MTRTPCPTHINLIRYLDCDLSQEDGENIAHHLSECPSCRAEDAMLHMIVEDLKSNRYSEFDVKEHVGDVMARLHCLSSTRKSKLQRFVPYGLIGSLAAAVLMCVVYFGPHDESVGRFQARGGGAETISIARDIGVQLYANKNGLLPLIPGSAIGVETPLTAGFRNLGKSPVYLLLFAIDESDTVHWISPMYTRIDQDPLATILPVSPQERLLSTTVVPDRLVKGTLRIVTVISQKPMRVSTIESLGAGINSPVITRHLPQAEVRELRVNVL